MSRLRDEGIWNFLTDLQHARKMRVLLLQRASENPELVLQYVSTLDDDQVRGDEILYRLKAIAEEANAPSRTVR